MIHKPIYAQVLETGDGSQTLLHPVIPATYHSVHGAISESVYVFVHQGFEYVAQKVYEIKTLEVGFGSGLNLLLTRAILEERYPEHKLFYVGLEAYPLHPDSFKTYRLPKQWQAWQSALEQLHQLEWNVAHNWGQNISLIKQHIDWHNFRWQHTFDLIYYDAFAPSAQADMWGEHAVEQLCRLTHVGSVLVTYCAQGAFRRLLRAYGFEVERLPGAPGKREMTRALRY